jgi:hypothetical protein
MRVKWTGEVAQALERLLCKTKALSSNPYPFKTMKRLSPETPSNTINLSSNLHQLLATNYFRHTQNEGLREFLSWWPQKFIHGGTRRVTDCPPPFGKD